MSVIPWVGVRRVAIVPVINLQVDRESRLLAAADRDLALAIGARAESGGARVSGSRWSRSADVNALA